MIASTWVFLLHAPELKRITKRIIWILNNSTHYLKSFQILSVVCGLHSGKYGLWWPWNWSSQISDNGAQLTNRPRRGVLTHHRVLTEAMLPTGCSWPVMEATGYRGRETGPPVTGHYGSSALLNILRTALGTRGPHPSPLHPSQTLPRVWRLSPYLSRILPFSLVSYFP